MKINLKTKLYTVNDIYSTMNHAKTFEMYFELSDINAILELDKCKLMHEFQENDVEAQQLIDHIELQQCYISKNISTLENVLFMHEVKLVKTEICFGLRSQISLN